MAVQDFDYVLMTAPDGTRKRYPVAFGTGCSVTSIQLSPAQLNALPDALPATPSGYVQKTRNCSAVTPPPPGNSNDYSLTGDDYQTNEETTN